MNKHLIAYIVLILIILYFVNKVLTAKSTYTGEDGKWTVYGTNGCGWTRKQLELMDSKNIPYTFVDCDSENCNGMDAYPTLIDPSGKKHVGFNTLE